MAAKKAAWTKKKAAKKKATNKKRSKKKATGDEGAEKKDKAYFYTNMSWFNTVENPGDITVLPPAFAEAKSLWEKDGERNFEKIQNLLGHYVSASFVPENITGADQLFTSPYGCRLLAVNVGAFDFKRGNIPRVKAEAWFEVDVVEGFHDIDLDRWQNENDRFYSAACFFWDIEGFGDEFDFSWENHSGCEGICLGPELDISADDFPRGG